MWNADRIRQLRRNLELSQTDLAQHLGCRQQTVSEWETGLYTPGNAYGKLLNMLWMRSTATPSPQHIKSEKAPEESQKAGSQKVSREVSYYHQSRSDFDAAID